MHVLFFFAYLHPMHVTICVIMSSNPPMFHSSAVALGLPIESGVIGVQQILKAFNIKINQILQDLKIFSEVSQRISGTNQAGDGRSVSCSSILPGYPKRNDRFGKIRVPINNFVGTTMRLFNALFLNIFFIIWMLSVSIRLYN